MLRKLYIKDIKVLLSDKKALLIFILMPIILTTILSFALKGSFGESGTMEPIKVAVVKAYDVEQEQRAFSETVKSMMGDQFDVMSESMNSFPDLEQILFTEFLGNEEVQSIMSTEVMALETAKKSLKNEEISVIVILPENFIYNQYVNFILPNRNPIEVSFIRHPDKNYSAQIVESVFGSYFNEINKKIVSKNVYLEVGSEYLEMDALFENMTEIYDIDGNEMALSDAGISHVKTTSLPGKRMITSFTYYAIAMMAMFILYSSSYMGRELLREKQMLTLDRGVVSGMHYGKVLTAKFLMTMTLCFFQMSALILFSKFALGVAWLTPLKVIVGILFSAMAVSGVGVFLGAVTLSAENYKIANLFESVLVHIFALIGGSYVPLEAFPEIFQKLKYIALNGVVLDLFVNTYQDSEWMKLALYYGILLGITIFFTVLAAFILKRKEVTSYEGTLKA